MSKSRRALQGLLTCLAVCIVTEFFDGLGEGLEEEVEELFLQRSGAFLDVTLLTLNNGSKRPILSIDCMKGTCSS